MKETAAKESFFMSPKVDFCFKELMKNSEVRRGFLSAVLNIPPREILETTLLPTHLEMEYAEDKLEIHIIELPKLKKSRRQETELLNWMRFINAEKEEEMRKMAERNGYIQTAYDELKMLSADERKRLAYEERLKAERDYISFANDNWRRGLKEGTKRGELLKLIRQTLRKQEKGLAPKETSELLEEDCALIQKIYRYKDVNPQWTEEELVETIQEE